MIADHFETIFNIQHVDDCVQGVCTSIRPSTSTLVLFCVVRRSQFAEMLSGRYADVLSGLFLGYSALWYTSHQKHVTGLDKVTDFAMQVGCHCGIAVPPAHRRFPVLPFLRNVYTNSSKNFVVK